jgi:hypothetical protein
MTTEYKNHQNLRNLSYSSELLAQTCPRKYRLAKLLYRQREESIHFDFGTVVGAAVAEYLLTKSVARAYMVALAKWPVDMDFVEKTVRNKTFWDVLQAIDKLVAIVAMALPNTEVFIYNDSPAIELGFRVDCGNNYYYRGYVDIVLFNKLTNSLLVVECKTTGAATVSESMYRNSGQAIGYEIVLDSLIAQHPELARGTNYQVVYLVYQTAKQDWIVYNFPKSRAAKAAWIKHILLEITRLETYRLNDYYPMYGSSCRNYNKDCTWFGLCEMPIENLLGSEIEMEQDKPTKYVFHTSLDDMIKDQVASLES